MFVLKSRIYLVYNLFCGAHFIQADDLSPVLPNIKPLEGEPNNVAVSLPTLDINFTEDELAEAKKAGDYFFIKDNKGVKRKIIFLKLENMLASHRSTARSERDSSFFS